MSNNGGRRMWAGILFIAFGMAWTVGGVYMIVNTYFENIHHTNRKVENAAGEWEEKFTRLRGEVLNICKSTKDYCETEFSRLTEVENKVEAIDLETQRVRERQRLLMKQRSDQ